MTTNGQDLGQYFTALIFLCAHLDSAPNSSSIPDDDDIAQILANLPSAFSEITRSIDNVTPNTSSITTSTGRNSIASTITITQLKVGSNSKQRSTVLPTKQKKKRDKENGNEMT
jgi:hypothetical protein